MVERLTVVHLARLPLGTSYTRGGLRPKVVAVTLTAGSKVHVRDREVSLPRSALFLPLQGALEAGRLRVAPACPHAAELADELLQARGGPSGAESRGAGRHGDLLVVVSLALWWQGVARM